MTYLQTGQAAEDDQFALRVQACLFKLSQDVLNEPNNTQNHVFRVQLAQRVTQNPKSVLGSFLWLCASNPSIAGSVTAEGSDVQVAASDGDIEFVCSSNWNLVAGWNNGGGVR